MAQTHSAEARAHSAELIGRQISDFHGHRLGKVDSLLTEDEGEGTITWAKVKMGLLGASTSFVPLKDATEQDGDLRLVYEKEHVKAAPEVHPDGDRLSHEDADALHRHYGLEPVAGLAATVPDEELDLPRETRDAKPPAMDESPDSPTVKRRLERARELGIPENDGG
jgi:hypothetical protein